MALWTSNYVCANGTRIHYYRTGKNRAPILLLHGVTDNGSCWTPVARLLEHEYDVIMLDARGHGLSDAPTTGFALSQLVADVEGVIHALGLERVFLLGHSMGAATAAHVAVRQPQLVRAVVLEDPPWSGLMPPGPDEAFARKWEESERWNKAHTSAELMVIARARNPGWSDDELVPWVEAREQLKLAIFQPGFAQTLHELQTAVEHIPCPALLLIGDANLGAYVTPEIASQVVATCDDGRIAHISHAGHSIRRDRFSQFMQIVTTFLKEH